TRTPAWSRGEGVQTYHSFEGERKVWGMPLAIGWLGSSTFRIAGKGGQLLLEKTALPRNDVNQGQSVSPSVYAATWNPSHPPPCFMYSSNAFLCGAVCGLSFSQRTRSCFARFAVFRSSQLVVAVNEKWFFRAVIEKKRTA